MHSHELTTCTRSDRQHTEQCSLLVCRVVIDILCGSADDTGYYGLPSYFWASSADLLGRTESFLNHLITSALLDIWLLWKVQGYEIPGQNRKGITCQWIDVIHSPGGKLLFLTNLFGDWRQPHIILMCFGPDWKSFPPSCLPASSASRLLHEGLTESNSHLAYKQPY